MMHKRILLSLILILLCACASTYAGWGDGAADRGNWDKAVKHYRKAVAKDPGNEEVRTKLEIAIGRAAEMHLEKGRKAAIRQDYPLAIAELKRSLEYRDQPEVRAVLSRVLDDKRRYDAQLEFTAGMRAEQDGDLTTAKEAYERARDLDPEISSLGGRLRDVERRIDRASALASKAQSALYKEDFDLAGRLASEALAIHPRNAVAQDVQETVLQEREAKSKEAAAREAKKRGDIALAASLIDEAVAARSTPAREKLAREYQRLAATHFEAKGDAAVSAYRWEDAVANYEKALDLGAAEALISKKLVEAKYQNQLSLALQAQGDGDLELALEHYREASEIKPYSDASVRVREIEEALGPKSMTAAELYHERIDSVVVVKTASGRGSGVIVGRNLILTSAQVIDGPRGKIITANGQRVQYRDAWVHRNADVALIWVEGMRGRIAPVGEGLRMRPGETVFAMGTHRGQDFTYSTGGISVVGRVIDGQTVLQHSAPLSRKSSGGPLFNEFGEVIGINTLTDHDGPNRSFAIPIEYGLDLIDQLSR